MPLVTIVTQATLPRRYMADDVTPKKHQTRNEAMAPQTLAVAEASVMDVQDGSLANRLGQLHHTPENATRGPALKTQKLPWLLV